FGFSFFPCSSFIVFNNHFHGHFHDGFHNGHFHDGFVAHNGSFHSTKNGGKFFSSHTGPSFASQSIAAHNRTVANFRGAGPPSVLGSTPRNAVNSRGAAIGNRGLTTTPSSRMGNNFSGQRTLN